MSVNGKYDDITRTDLLKLAAINDIKEASHIIDEVCEACRGWTQIARDCGVPQEMTDGVAKNMTFL